MTTSTDRPAVTVVGAGLMGSGIAQVLATAGCPVRLHDVRESQLTAAQHEVEHGRYGLGPRWLAGSLTPPRRSWRSTG